MAHHSHVRFTPAPKGLPVIETYDLSGIETKFEKVIITHEESKDKIPHYHIWIESDVCEKSVRNYVVEALRIPKCKRGQTNGYYVLKFDAYTKPSPAYVLKEGNVLCKKGYTEEEIAEYIAEGESKFGAARNELPRQVVSGGEAAGNKTLIDQFLEYMEEVLPKDKTQPFTLDMLKRQNYAYWKQRNGGLFPQRSTEQRFIKSAWAQWCDITRRCDALAIADLEEKNLL